MIFCNSSCPHSKSGNCIGLRAVISRFPFFLILIGMIVLLPEQSSETVKGAVSDAYIAVSSFVAATLFFFYLLETGFKLDSERLLEKYSKLHVPIAAFMGVLPGCGGAIVVMTQYVAGRLGFGSVVAVLTATMGDAAFLLLAQKPLIALLVYAISFTVGVLSGYIVEKIHGHDFMRQQIKKKMKEEDFSLPHIGEMTQSNPLFWAWVLLIIPGFVLGIGNAFQIDTDLWFGELAKYSPTTMIGVSGGLLSILIWMIYGGEYGTVTTENGKVNLAKVFSQLCQRVAVDTSFVTVWVIYAFVAFELSVLWSGVDLKALFDSWSGFLPLIGVLIGFIPGCGPQIVVSSAYLSGLIPFSVQIGNAISNDGDALFPAIAMAPKAALVATLYTAIPALIVSYGWYFLFEI